MVPSGLLQDISKYDYVHQPHTVSVFVVLYNLTDLPVIMHQLIFSDSLS